VVRHAIETIMDKWDIRFLALAQHIAAWSKDPSTKCGAVIVDGNRKIVGVGYNGFPRGVDDQSYRYDNRDSKLKLTVHAEANAILNANNSVEHCDLYVWPLPPCNECAKLIIQAGICNVFAPKLTGELKKRWNDSVGYTHMMFSESGVDLYQLELGDKT
jgi:dCMP deaminase